MQLDVYSLCVQYTYSGGHPLCAAYSSQCSAIAYTRAYAAAAARRYSFSTPYKLAQIPRGLAGWYFSGIFKNTGQSEKWRIL